MKKLALSLLFCGAAALAAPVTYSTSAILSGPDAVGSILASGGATLTFTGVPSTAVDSPTNISLGAITAAGGPGTFAGDMIVLTITQTDPTPGGSDTSSSTIDGLITTTSNGIDLSFMPTSFTIASDPSVTYVLQSEYFLVAPNTNGGVTSLQASVTASPEPASIGLLGASLLGFGLLTRRMRLNK
jgi:hypothetical protein